ncbi:MAG TPA: DnaJ C-terminal domain-containing protein [Chloroflexota bacterium]|nr:DnaJ C-terminal domain-containing protein [Chloroflexota bacterium]
MEYKDYYKILGVAKNANEKDIRQAYRKLARQLHPDLKPGDKESEKRFKEVNEAYEVLGDQEKRKKYDELGSNWNAYEQWQRAGGPQSGQPFDWSSFGGVPGGAPGGTRYEYRQVSPDELRNMFGDEGSPFSDFFQTFFGGTGGGGGGGRRTSTRTRAPRVGQAIEHPVEITIEEAFRGTTRVLQLSDPRGGAPRRIEVKIPPGVTQGSRIRVAGQGMPGTAGGAAGDLYLIVQLEAGGAFAREGNDVRVQVPVPLTTAVLGGEVEVPTPKGTRLALKIPENTQNGRVFRLRGQGMPAIGGGPAGDLFAEVRVVLPESLSPRQRELFQELAELEAPAASARN